MVVLKIQFNKHSEERAWNVLFILNVNQSLSKCCLYRMCVCVYINKYNVACARTFCCFCFHCQFNQYYSILTQYYSTNNFDLLQYFCCCFSLLSHSLSLYHANRTSNPKSWMSEHILHLINVLGTHWIDLLSFHFVIWEEKSWAVKLFIYRRIVVCSKRHS